MWDFFKNFNHLGGRYLSLFKPWTIFLEFSIKHSFFIWIYLKIPQLKGFLKTKLAQFHFLHDCTLAETNAVCHVIPEALIMHVDMVLPEPCSCVTSGINWKSISLLNQTGKFKAKTSVLQIFCDSASFIINTIFCNKRFLGHRAMIDVYNLNLFKHVINHKGNRLGNFELFWGWGKDLNLWPRDEHSSAPPTESSSPNVG